LHGDASAPQVGPSLPLDVTKTAAAGSIVVSSHPVGMGAPSGSVGMTIVPASSYVPARG